MLHRGLPAQVEHNYLVGPQKTTCDSLGKLPDDFSSAILKVENAGWRFQQNMKLNRPFGFRNAQYYSCNIQSGYLVILINKTRCIYKEVPLDLWNRLTESLDPDRFISANISNKFERLCNSTGE